MNRCYWGAAALLVLLILSILSSWWMGKHYTQLEEQMLSAAQSAREGDLDQALTLTDRARTGWNRGWLLTSVLADHQYLERIDGAFVQLPPAAEGGNGEECTRLCLVISQLFRLLSEEPQLRWENLL